MRNLHDSGAQLLRKSEGVFHTDMIYLARGGFWLSVSQVVATIAGFCISLAFANLISKEAFGTYKFIISVTGIVGALTLTGMGTAITQSVAKGYESLKQGFKTNLRWSVGIGAAGLVLALYYYLEGNTTIATSFFMMAIFYPITVSAGLYSPYLLGKKDFPRNSLYTIIYSLFPALLMIVTLFVTKNIWIIAGVYFASSAITAAFLYRRTLKAYSNVQETHDPELFSYSKHLSIMEVIGRVASQIDKVLIFHYLGAAPLAIYSFATAPVEQLQSGKKILSTLVLPKVAGRPFEELQKITPRKTLLLIIYAILLVGLWTIIAPYFYKFLYPQYLDSVFYSQIYAFTILAIAGVFFQETLVAHQKTRALYFHRTIVPIIQLILFFIMLPLYGLMGLVMTHVIVRSLSGLILYCLVKFSN